MDRTVAHLNIEHYRKLLTQEMDEIKRQTILRLVAVRKRPN
jgi:molybdopterin synthase catalytic subunit